MGCGASTDASIGKQSFNKRHASLKQIFESLDADGDGKVSLYDLDAKLKADTEVQDLLEKRGRATRRRSAAYVASVLLKNKTNTANPIITFKDFKREVEKTELRDLFDLIDEDGDGTISKAELNAKLEQDYDIQEKLQAAHGSGYQFVFDDAFSMPAGEAFGAVVLTDAVLSALSGVTHMICLQTVTRQREDSPRQRAAPLS
ncbi:hypothetical protein AB1Y20_018693 [Prymnesium parvum]|uniref:EF-hand domain-containing protein n=1 Tax=Prymnesium parvum TaxID=97485 RepID=A0AB34JS76_PRYPA